MKTEKSSSILQIHSRKKKPAPNNHNLRQLEKSDGGLNLQWISMIHTGILFYTLSVRPHDAQNFAVEFCFGIPHCEQNLIAL